MEKYSSTQTLESGQILDSPTLWGQAFLVNRDGTPRKYWPHQVDDLECKDKNIIHLDGRDVGKTVNLSTLALHYACTSMGGSVLIAAPHQGHLDSIIEEIEHQLNSNRDLMASVALNPQGRPKITRKPYFKIEFTNNSTIYFRPAGSYGDAFRSLHVDFICVDEGAWLPEKAWKALRQCLKADGILRIYSTPNGLRNTTYHRLTKLANWTVMRWPSWLSPTWTDERTKELEEFYGGKDTAGWQHEVAGEHGRPSYGAFNIEYLNLCRQEVPEYLSVSITGEELKDCETEEDVEERLDMLLNLVPQSGNFWVGSDTGYTNDPTEIVLFKETEDHGRIQIKLILRVHLEHVAYPHVSACLGLIDRYYNPAGVGLDNGGNGVAVAQELTSLDKYRPLGLKDRLRGFNFGGSVSIFLDDGREVKKPTKEQMTSLINGCLQRRQLVLPINDLDIESQFTTHTYTLHNGRVKYSKGNDHLVDAIRCMALVREQLKDGDGWDSSTVEFVVPLQTEPLNW